MMCVSCSKRVEQRENHHTRKGKDVPGKFLVAVSAIIEREGKILMLQRSPFIDHGAGEWEFVSGSVSTPATFPKASGAYVR
jgi:8-oxo-dGTP pyrophosphatase MutT (NUDIX family)